MPKTSRRKRSLRRLQLKTLKRLSEHRQKWWVDHNGSVGYPTIFWLSVSQGMFALHMGTRSCCSKRVCILEDRAEWNQDHSAFPSPSVCQRFVGQLGPITALGGICKKRLLRLTCLASTYSDKQFCHAFASQFNYCLLTANFNCGFPSQVILEMTLWFPD